MLFEIRLCQKPLEQAFPDHVGKRHFNVKKSTQFYPLARVVELEGTRRPLPPSTTSSQLEGTFNYGASLAPRRSRPLDGRIALHVIYRDAWNPIPLCAPRTLAFVRGVRRWLGCCPHGGVVHLDFERYISLPSIHVLVSIQIPALTFDKLRTPEAFDREVHLLRIA